MSKKPEFVQLEPGDDIASVRDRLSFIRGERVLLIWPEEGTVLTRKLDLVLVQREAMRRAIRLALVTHDTQVIKHAEELNISTFETIGASERSRWKRGRAKVFTNRDQRPEDEPEPTDLMPVASRVRVEEPPEARTWRTLSRLLVLLLLVGALITAAYVLLPSATITLTPLQEGVQSEVQITADPQAADVDVENAVIPATILRVEIEETGTVPTTGEQSLPNTPAAGSVIFVNQTANSVAIPIGTTVSTSAGTPILFSTTEEAALPGEVGSQIEVPIQAVEESSGPVGNVDSGLINTVIGDLAEAITVRNLAPTSGGEARSLKAVSVDDVERLLATVRQQIQSRAYVSMLPRLTETQFVIDQTIRISEERSDWMTYSAEPGDVADNLSLTMRAVVEAVAVDGKFGQQIVFAELNGQILQGSILRPETITYERGPVIEVFQDGKTLFTMIGSGMVTGQVNTSALQERLAGRSLEDARTYILGSVKLADGSAPEIIVAPDWLGRMPILPMRIDVRVQNSPLS
jgi:hypothetical protein